MLKRKSLLIFALVFTFSATAFLFCHTAILPVNADEGTPEMVTTVDRGFILEDSGRELTGFNVPAEVDGYFEVVIPFTVQRIRAGSFVGTEEAGEKISRYLVSVEIPQSVMQIEEGAFVDCKNLVEVCIHNTILADSIQGTGLQDVFSIVTSVEDKTLHTVSEGSENYLFVRDGGTESAAWVLVAYEGAASELILPEASKCDKDCTGYVIYNSVFADCVFTSVTFSADITEISESAFSGCTKLESVELNEGLKSIGAYAFYNTSVFAITVPQSVEKIDSRAFGNCTNLSTLNFADRTSAIVICDYAFASCTGLKIITLPVNAEIRQYAFSGCISLLWAYIGDGTKFINTLGSEDSGAIFFPKNDALKIVFSNYNAYNTAINQQDNTFKYNNSNSAAYLVNVNCYVGGSLEPVVYQRMYGEKFDYVYNEQTGEWNTDAAFADLPVQAEHYISTVWYEDKELNHKVDIDRTNALLSSPAVSEINFYCYETVNKPVFQSDPITWVYNKDVSYSVNDISAVLKALSCQNLLTEKELAAISYDVVYADADSNIVQTPKEICQNGVYSITFKLDEKYGAWNEPIASSITINVDTSPFFRVLIVFLIVAFVAAFVTIITAIVRKRVQTKNKKKQISSQEALEKFRAAGGETTLK